MTGRPPTGAALLRPHVTEAISAAVLQEWTDKGYVRMSMEAVARRAGVGKSALYRRWPSKQEMAMAVLAQLSAAMFAVPDTGSLHGDLEALMRTMLDWLEQPHIAVIGADLVAETTRDPKLGEAVETILRAPHRAQTQTVFDRAIARGELDSAADPDIILELIASIIYWHSIVRALPVTDDYLRTVVTTIQHGLTPTTGPPRSRRVNRSASDSRRR